MSLLQVIESIGPGRWGFSVQRQPFAFGTVVYPDRHANEDMLRALEEAGSATADLAKTLMDAYHQNFPCFRGLGDGFRRRDHLHPNSPEMGLWALVTFRDGWRVLEYLGTSWDGLLNHLLARWPPNMWLDDAELLRVPQELQGVIHPEGLVYGPQTSGLDLEWLPPRLACGLTVMGPIPRVRLPKALDCRGPIHLQGLGAIRTLRGITAPRQCLTVIGCQDLDRIDLPTDTKLAVKDCCNLAAITGKVTADLHVEDCPSLETINVVFPRDAHPAPALTIRHCHRLKAIGQHTSVARICGVLTLEDCPELGFVQPRLIRGKKAVSNCPALGPLKSGW